MPIKKRSLTPAEQAVHEASIRELRAGNCYIQASEHSHRRPSRLKIEIDPLQENLVCNLPGSGCVYVIWITLTALCSGIILRDWDLEANWDSYLEPDVAPDDIQVLDRVLGSLPDRREIFNYRMDKGLRLSHRGDMFAGVLLARGARQVPLTYKTETRVPVTLKFLDQLNFVYGIQAQVTVIRRKWRSIWDERQASYKGLIAPEEVAEANRLGIVQRAVRLSEVKKEGRLIILPKREISDLRGPREGK